MVQRDLIKDQIEQIGKALGKILVDFLGLDSTAQMTPGIEIANQQLQSQLDIDVSKIVALNDQELRTYLQQLNLTAGHLEMLSEYLTVIGRTKIEANNDTAKLYLAKAIELLDIADEVSQTLSMERMNKKEYIDSLLNI